MYISTELEKPQTKQRKNLCIDFNLFATLGP